jgi:plastocyanin
MAGAIDAQGVSSSADEPSPDGSASVDPGGAPDASSPMDALSPDASASVDSGAVPDASPQTWTVLVGANGAHVFSPSALTIGVGDTVHWVWQASGHTVTSGAGRTADGRFCSPADTQCPNAPTSNAGDSYDHLFSIAGSFPYFCTQHEPMTGSITVR